MKIPTTYKLLDFKGQPLLFEDSDLTLGVALAQILSFSKRNHLKAYVLAQRLYSEKDPELDDADFAFVKDVIGSSEVFNSLVTGQALQKLESLKAA